MKVTPSCFLKNWFINYFLVYQTSQFKKNSKNKLDYQLVVVRQTQP